MKYNNLTGQVFNSWTVIGSPIKQKNETFYECRCVCGTVRLVRAHSLAHNKSSGCGCAKVKNHHGTASLITNDKGNPVHDLTGQHFKMLTVIQYSHSGKNTSFWICRCECGNEVVASSTTLKRGQKLSCGCISARTKHDIGERYGRLVVIKMLPKAKRLCICDCGNKVTVSSVDMRYGRIQSCGCLRKETMSDLGVRVGQNNVYQSSRYNWLIDLPSGQIRLRSGYELIYAEYLIRNSIVFKYEPQVFTLSPSMRYVPDFYLPDLDLWVEIKGEVTEKSLEKMKLFAQVTGNKIKMVTTADINDYLEGGFKYKTWLKRNAHKYLR